MGGITAVTSLDLKHCYCLKNFCWFLPVKQVVSFTSDWKVKELKVLGGGVHSQTRDRKTKCHFILRHNVCRVTKGKKNKTPIKSFYCLKWPPDLFLH